MNTSNNCNNTNSESHTQADSIHDPSCSYDDRIPIPKNNNNNIDIADNIELRLKPRHPTFDFSVDAGYIEQFQNEDENNDSDDHHHQAQQQHHHHGVYTEKTLRVDEIDKERHREEELDREMEMQRQERKREREEDMKMETASVYGNTEEGGDEGGEDKYEEELKGENGNMKTKDKPRRTKITEGDKGDVKKKGKPAPVSSINARDILVNIHKVKSLDEISGTVAMSILLLLVDELIWLSDMISNGLVNDKDITENVFGDRLFDGILDHFNDTNINSNNNSGGEDVEMREEVLPEDSATRNKEKFFIDEILSRILNKKVSNRDKKKLELISKSQEELGVSLRQDSKILSNFELDEEETPTLTVKDLNDFVHDNIGKYEKCSTDIETLTWISNKFYLKSAPKMELTNYLDRINSHLEISGAVGLCAGWYLFKFLFNLKCDEKLSNGITGHNLQYLNKNLQRDVDWENRCLPLVLGNSFKYNSSTANSSATGSSSFLTGDEGVNNEGDIDKDMGSKANESDHTDGVANPILNAIYSQEMDTSCSSVSSFINDDEGDDLADPITNPTTTTASTTISNFEVHMSKLSKLNAFRLILTCIRISSKLIEDKNFKQHYYCKVTGLQKLEDLFRLELALGYGLDWELFINEYTLWRYLFHMKALVLGCENLRAKIAGDL